MTTYTEQSVHGITQRQGKARKGAVVARSPLARLAGPLALAAGALFTANQFVTLATVEPDDAYGYVTSTVYLANGIALFVAFSLMLLTLVAAHEWQSHRAGVLGVVGLCAAVVGTFAYGANVGWFEVFATPWMADVAPEVIGTKGSGSLAAGGFSSYVLFSVGWLLFGLASLRARVFPRIIALALALGGILAFNASPPFGVLLGVAITALGVWMLRATPPAGNMTGPESH